VPLAPAWPEPDADWYHASAPPTPTSLPPKTTPSKFPILTAVIGGASVLFAVGVVVIAFGGNIGSGKPTPTTAGEGEEPTRTDTPVGWKTFRTSEVRVWVPESVGLMEGDDTDARPPLEDKTSWTNWQPPSLVLKAKPVSNPSGMWFWVNSGRLTPKFLAEHGRTPAAAEVALKQLDDSSPGEEWSDATLGGLPARQRVIKVTAPDPPQQKFVTTTRAVIRGETLYWCAVSCTEAAASESMPTTFLDSFRFEYGPPTGVKAVGVVSDPPALPSVKLPAQWRKYQADVFSVGVKEAAQATADGVADPTPDDPFFKRKRSWVFESTAGGKVAHLSVTTFVVRPSLAREFQEDPSAALDGLVKVFAQGRNPAGEKVTAVTVGGVEGKQVTHPDQVTRLAVRGDTLYVLSVGEPGIGPTDATAKTFFDSFRFER
jgi:hypothetical protein